jgi:hypothetical protein
MSNLVSLMHDLLNDVLHRPDFPDQPHTLPAGHDSGVDVPLLVHSFRLAAGGSLNDLLEPGAL